MAYTEKQLRNGATGDSSTQDTAQPSTDLTGTISGLQSQAVAAGNANMTEGHVLTGGLYGHSVSYEWDAGLAIGEMPGEM